MSAHCTSMELKASLCLNKQLTVLLSWLQSLAWWTTRADRQISRKYYTVLQSGTSRTFFVCVFIKSTTKSAFATTKWRAKRKVISPGRVNVLYFFTFPFLSSSQFVFPISISDCTVYYISENHNHSALHFLPAISPWLTSSEVIALLYLDVSTRAKNRISGVHPHNKVNLVVHSSI